ncbi:chromate transporter [Paenibacillus silviterrae]|uniref:chromate transporter n=1 Tax=Paenibacillus silviterrae TaxID=3242194 RepID=UPI002543199A|nr:chromate transporter [Paenibacillus chinjuensis]
MIYWELFITFFIVGLVSFGGGYAMFSIIERQVTSHGWMTTQEFTNAFSVAGMSPGPIGTNSAIFVGYKTAALPGAVFAAAGMVLPSLILVILVGLFFTKFHKNKWVQSAFYGLRPIVTGLIMYGAIRFAVSNQLIGTWGSEMIGALAFFACSLIALVYFRIHPLYVIMISGLTGIAIYS